MTSRKSLLEAAKFYNNEKELIIQSLKPTTKNEYNYADIVYKLSKTGLLTHKRILQIKNGFLYYYSHVPRDWKPNSFQLLRENPKIALRLTEILIHYLGMDEAKGTKYLYLHVNQRKMVSFKTGKNYIEKFSPTDAVFKDFEPSQKNLGDIRIVFSIKIEDRKYNKILDLIDEKIRFEKTPPEVPKPMEKPPIISPPKKEAPQIKLAELFGPKQEPLIEDSSSDHELVKEEIPVSEPESEEKVEPPKKKENPAANFEPIEEVRARKSPDFPQQSHIFSNIKPKELTKSYFNHSIRDFEADFYGLLEHLREEKDHKLREPIYSDIFSLFGEFNLFCEKALLSFLEFLKEPSSNFPDIIEITEANQTFIRKFSSDRYNITIECVLPCADKDPKNLRKALKDISNTFKSYDFIMNGLLLLNEGLQSPLGFRVPLARLLRVKGINALIYTRNPLYAANELELVQGLEGEEYRVSRKFIEEFTPFLEFIGVPVSKGSKTGGIPANLLVFQKIGFSDYYYILNPGEIIPESEQKTEELMVYLENLREIPLDSFSVSRVFHSLGVKMSSLGILFQKTQQIYLQELLLREIISRSCKRILFEKILNSMDFFLDSEKRAIDFVNTLFGKEEESIKTWNQLIPKEIAHYYGVAIKTSIENINEPLFYKIINECGLDIHTTEFPLQQPLKSKDFKAFKQKTKGYSLKGLEFYAVLEDRSNIAQNHDVLDCFQANLGLFTFSKMMGNVNSAYFYGENLIELYIRNENYEQARSSLLKLLGEGDLGVEALIRGHFLLFRIHTALGENDCIDIFAFILKQIQTNFGAFHSYHILLYMEMGRFYKYGKKAGDAIFLYKNALICASKILGPKHWLFPRIYEELGECYLSLESLENALFYWQKSFEIVRIKGLGFKIAGLLLRMNLLLEAKDFFLKLIHKKLGFFTEDFRNSDVFEKKAVKKISDFQDFEENDIEVLLNLSHISLILNDVSEGQKYLDLALEINRKEDFMIEYEEKFVKLAFFLSARQIPQKNRKYLWIISRSLIEQKGNQIPKTESLAILREETKKHWNLMAFFKNFFEELIFVCQKNEYINNSEYWRVYLRNLHLKDPHNMKKCLTYLGHIIDLVGEKPFIEELMR